MDQLPEFKRTVLESLRRPQVDKVVTLSRRVSKRLNGPPSAANDRDRITVSSP